jgi:hypothetical protein
MKERFMGRSDPRLRAAIRQLVYDASYYQSLVTWTDEDLGAIDKMIEDANYEVHAHIRRIRASEANTG